MKFLKIIQEPKYFFVSILATTFMLLLYPIIQTVPQGLHNLDLWFEIITPLNFILYFIFSVLFGLLVSVQIYQWNYRECKTLRSSTAGTIGTFSGLLIGQCASCLSITSLLLPFGVATFLLKYNTYVMLISIGFLLTGMYFLKGFEEHS